MGKVVDLTSRRLDREYERGIGPRHVNCRCRLLPRVSAPISAQVHTDGLVHMDVPSRSFALSADEAEAWADNLRQLAAWAREEASR